MDFINPSLLFHDYLLFFPGFFFGEILAGTLAADIMETPPSAVLAYASYKLTGVSEVFLKRRLRISTSTEKPMAKYMYPFGI